MEYWLISTPTEKKADESWKTLTTSVAKVKNCAAFKFYIPKLKVGTLDTLLMDADNLSKLEMYLDGVISRLATGLSTVLLDNEAHVKDILTIYGKPLDNYLMTFKWDSAKYPIKQTIRSISELAQKQASQVETEYKIKFQDYVSAKAAYDAVEKIGQGSLMTKSLFDSVTDDDFVLDSQFMTTILVVIPKKLLNEWNRLYERLDETVIPKSSRIITEDADFFLSGVTLFKEGVDNFINNCKKYKFIVRDHLKEREEELLNKEKLLELQNKKEEMYEPLVKMLKHNLSEMFNSSIHIKSCKLFVESVLRYGLPADFRTAVISVHKKNAKKLRDILHNLYKHLDAGTVSDGDKVASLETVAAMGQNASEYYPYVAVKVNVDSF